MNYLFFYQPTNFNWLYTEMSEEKMFHIQYDQYYFLIKAIDK